MVLALVFMVQFGLQLGSALAFGVCVKNRLNATGIILTFECLNLSIVRC